MARKPKLVLAEADENLLQVCFMKAMADPAELRKFELVRLMELAGLTDTDTYTLIKNHPADPLLADNKAVREMIVIARKRFGVPSPYDKV